MSSRIELMLCVLLGTAVTAGAQPPPAAPLTLEDCVRLALKAPSVATVAEHQVKVAQEDRTIAKSGFLPTVRVENTFAYNSPLLSQRDQFSYVAANGIREYMSVVDARWELDLSGRLRAGLAFARAQRNLADSERRLARRDLRRVVAVAFYDALLTRHLVVLEQAGLKEAADFDQRVRQLEAHGEASKADIYKASAQRAQFERRLARAKLNERLANQALAAFWTSDVDRKLELVDVIEKPPAPPSEVVAAPASSEEAVNRRPELARFDALRSTFEAQRLAARSALKPQTSVVFQYGIDSNNVRIADRGYAAYVNLSIPVFDWFRARGTARQARYREQQVRDQQSVARRQFSREYAAALASVRSLHERIPLAAAELHDLRENLRLSRLLYEGGEGLALDVVVAQTAAANSGASYFAAVADYMKALVDFEVASGK